MGNLARRLEKLEAAKAEELELHGWLTHEGQSWQQVARELGISEADIIAEAERIVSSYEQGLMPPELEQWVNPSNGVSIDQVMEEARLLIRDWKAQHEPSCQAD
jgi:hypothetical protein